MWMRLAICGVAVATCGCAAGLPATAFSALAGTTRVASVYQTSEVPPSELYSRIDFEPRKGGISYVRSTIGSAAEVRARSEFGGVTAIVRGGGYLKLRGFVLYVPDQGVKTWADGEMRCSASGSPAVAVRVDCTWGKNGKRYSSLYSSLRGFEWFDAFCLDRADEICRYALGSPNGLLSPAMPAASEALGRAP